MGKKRPKTPPELPPSVNETNWDHVAADLYQKGLISQAALGTFFIPAGNRHTTEPTVQDLPRNHG